MIKEIKITNFYSFSEETIILQPDVNILIGINGSGKSNFLKAVRLLKEGVSGMGLEKYIFEYLGVIENVIFKGKNEVADNITVIEYTFDEKELNKNKKISNGEDYSSNHVLVRTLPSPAFHFSGDIVYTIAINKSPAFQNYYIQERIATKKGFEYLKFDNGIGYLKETFKEHLPPLSEKRVSKKIKYTEFNPKELALKQVNDYERYWALASIKKAINDIEVYDYFDTTRNSSIRNTSRVTLDKRLNTDGTNLPQILQTFKHNHKPAYNKIVEMLAEVNPNFLGFDFKLYVDGNIALMLEEKGLNSAITASNISDGTLKYLCLLAILYNPERGRFICIDEPETGLHPDMITNIANAIKEASKESTLIISTHSVDLLNYFRVENLQIFEKNENNATEVVRYNENQFEGWYDTFNVGQMWVAGDFGGVRYGG